MRGSKTTSETLKKASMISYEDIKAATAKCAKWKIRKGRPNRLASEAQLKGLCTKNSITQYTIRLIPLHVSGPGRH